MKPPNLFSKTIRVKNIRSQNPRGYGGAIFSGTVIGTQGKVEDATETVVVKVPFALLDGIKIEQGQWWDVYGESELYQRELNGYQIKERQLLPHQMQLLRPSGEHIIHFIADNKAFQGLGRVKVQQLWDNFGEDIYQILDEANVNQLTQVISIQIAHGLVDAWQQYGDTKTLQWLV